MKQTSSFKKICTSIFKNALVRNLFLAVLVLVVLVAVTLYCLNLYTHHGESVVVPDVKGMQVEAAAPFLERSTLHYLVVDSTFFRNRTPGSIVETYPQVGSRVKEGRTIYLTINSFSTQTFTVPEVQDLSQRQALAMLKATGFENVQVAYVPGAYRDLVKGLTYRGRAVNAGEKIPGDAPLYLQVSSGQEEVISNDDSVEIENPDESWY